MSRSNLANIDIEFYTESDCFRTDLSLPLHVFWKDNVCIMEFGAAVFLVPVGNGHD